MGKIGCASLEFEKKPYIKASACVAGKKEGEGPLGPDIDKIIEKPEAGQNCWEEAERELQRQMLEILMEKGGVSRKSLRYIFAGDLLGQIIATSFAVEDYRVPLFGLYGACSTMGEAMSLASIVVSAGYADNVVAMTSSHFASAEKQFRFPLDYGSQRPLSSTWTVTGSGGVIISSEKSNVAIRGITTGRIIDYGVTDSMNMGAAMAPAACDLIYQNLADFEIKPDFYDAIYTGDLGKVGQTILIDLLLERGVDITSVHHDCGIEIFDNERQGTYSGGSGCGCSAVTLCSRIIKKLEMGELNRVLFVPTGALLSTTSFNEGKSVPGIAHGVILERMN